MSTSIILTPLQNDKCKLQKTGLEIADNIPFDDWQDIGVALQFMGVCIQFALGDWLNYGERAYGEKYTQAVNETPYSYGALRNFAYVCRRVDLSRRHDKLLFEHHSKVAKLEPDEQTAALEVAYHESLSARQLQQRISQARNEPVTMLQCPNCGHEW